MFSCPERKWALFTAPKTASTAISYALEAKGYQPHMPDSQQHPTLTPGARHRARYFPWMNQYSIYVTAREPVSRLVSLWNHFGRTVAPTHWAKFLLRRRDLGLFYMDLVDIYRPITEYRMLHVIRVEDLQQSLESMVNDELDLPPIQSTVFPFLEQEAKDCFQHEARRDADRFGYW